MTKIQLVLQPSWIGFKSQQQFQAQLAQSFTGYELFFFSVTTTNISSLSNVSALAEYFGNLVSPDKFFFKSSFF